MSSSSEYKIRKSFFPRKCTLCGKIVFGKCVRRLREWSYQYFCCPKCAKEYHKSLEDKETSYNTENSELHAYLDKD